MGKTLQRWVMKDFGATHLAQETVALPQPAAGEVLVQVKAAALNYRDVMVVENGMGMALDWPQVPGSDMAGVVVAVGTGVTRAKVGDRVVSTFWHGWHDGAAPAGIAALGGPLPGVLADHVVLSQDDIVLAPASLSDAEAATLTCAGLTAWTALVETGGLRAGQTVVVQGTGGVALFALQLAVAQGAEVIVISGSDDKLARAQTLGAKHGINRNKHPDWAAEVLRLTDGRGADHVVELVGGDNVAKSQAALAQGGRLSVIGLLDDMAFNGSILPFLQKRLTVQGIGVGHRHALENLVRAIDRAGIKPVIDTEYGFDELPQALAHQARGGFGKIVLRVA